MDAEKDEGGGDTKVGSLRKPRNEPADPHPSSLVALHKQRSAYLQREHGRPVAHVAADDMALDGEHPAFALHAGQGCSGARFKWCHGLELPRPSLGLRSRVSSARAGAMLGCTARLL